MRALPSSAVPSFQGNRKCCKQMIQPQISESAGTSGLHSDCRGQNDHRVQWDKSGEAGQSRQVLSGALEASSLVTGGDNDLFLCCTYRLTKHVHRYRV